MNPAALPPPVSPTSSGRYNAHDTIVVILTSIFCPLALMAVALRFAARFKRGAKLWWDDATAVLTLLLYYAFCAMILLGEPCGKTCWERC